MPIPADKKRKKNAVFHEETSVGPPQAAPATAPSLVSSGYTERQDMPTLPPEPDRTGWLYKKSPAFHKQWQNRYFVLRKSQLFYYKDPKVHIQHIQRQQRTHSLYYLGHNAQGYGGAGSAVLS